MISDTDAFFVETASSQGWLNADQISALQEALSQDSSQSACNYLLQQGWLGMEHVAWLHQILKLQDGSNKLPSQTTPETVLSQQISQEKSGNLSGTIPPPNPSLKTTLKSLETDIAQSRMTIPQLMAARGIEGGIQVDFQGPPSHSIASQHDHKYQIGKMIAQGGMGVVLNVQDLNLQRTVAMKVILAGEQESPEHIQRFIEEAQITGQLSHPNIVPVHELGVDAHGRVFYTMKFVEGTTLHEVLHQIRTGDKTIISQYPLGHLLTIFQKVCDAVALAHSKGIVHRDLKPANIMIGDFGEVLVMDWGLAKVLSRRKSHVPKSITSLNLKETGGNSPLRTVDGQVMGTPGFMSPEQAKGQVEEIDVRSDIYALGCILYNILTLESPVSGRNTDEILAKTISGEIRPPLTFNPSSARKFRSKLRIRDHSNSISPVLLHCPDNRVPESLSIVTMKALARNAEDRYQSVKELQKDIEAYQEGFATSVESAGALKQLQLLVKRHRTEALLLAASFIIFISLATLFVIRLSIEKDRALMARNEARENERLARKNERRAILSEKRAMAASEERRQAMERLAEVTKARSFVADRLKAVEDRVKTVERIARANEERANRIAERATLAEKNAKIYAERAAQSELRIAEVERAPIEKLGIVRETASAFHDIARSLIDAQKFEGALEKISYAIELAPKEAEYHYLKGNVLQSLLRIEQAKHSYAQVLQLNPGHALASENLKLCEEILKGNKGKELSLSSLNLLHAAMQKQNRSAEALALGSKLAGGRPPPSNSSHPKE